MNLKSMLGPREVAAVGVGVIDIATRTMDAPKGVQAPFASLTDKVRAGVTVLSLIGNMVAKGKTVAYTEGAFLASLPLFELTVYRYARSASGGALPFFLQRKTGRVTAVSSTRFAANPGIVETAANGGIPVISTGISIGSNSNGGRLY